MESTLFDFVPILIQIAFSTVFVLFVIIVSTFLGPSRRAKGKNVNFECGLDSIGNARSPFAIKYFLVAILFVLFDIEIIFMYPWAINFSELGISGFLKMGGFIGLLFIGYLYIVKRKALEWEK
ncbi:NADH-quinone oxidoreductase subunit A [Dysgonomonas sp. 520]|uniref:NADH-quinone oxidoreductase subunit A n=1 Tax=Dysgonomonas sp. 520 TaxID=2302931 RepID=UPI0013D361DF|nr:NADH-quinone oxidoreductase subunit A [Dysgonomonas sp. 520]NDW08913.1 NADH-quinone oxidoreductase subunit A [Dysgonomonas sp. 520]